MATAQLILSGTLTLTPTAVVGTTTSVSPQGTVPAGTDQIPLVLTPNPKPSAKRANGNKLSTSAYGTFVAVSGIGATDNVQTADTLLVTTDAPLQLQLTLQNLAAGGVGTVTSVVSVYGTQLFQFPPAGLLVGLAAAGSGNLEYLASGPQ
jgi:hypothetical protein